MGKETKNFKESFVSFWEKVLSGGGPGRGDFPIDSARRLGVPENSLLLRAIGTMVPLTRI